MTLLVELWLLARLVALQGIVGMSKTHHGHEHLDIAVAQEVDGEHSSVPRAIRRYRHDPLLRHIVDAMDPSNLHRRARLVDPWHRDATSELSAALVRSNIWTAIAIDFER